MMDRRSLLQTLGLVASTAMLPCALADAYTEFHTAIIRDDYVKIHKLLQRGMDPNTVDINGRPALVRALQLDSLRVVQELIKYPGIRINAITPQGETALMLACIKGHIDLVRVFLFMGGAVNQVGWSPLHYAASAATENSVEIAALLLEQGAQINALSPNGSTPLMLAAQYGSEGMVRLLSRAGADFKMRNQLGLGVLDFAQKSDRDFMVRLVRNLQNAR